MHYNNIVALSLPVLGALAAPHPQASSSPTTTASSCGSTSSAAPETTPAGPFGIISAHSTSKIHLLPWTASGQAFYLGGETATYCPDVVGSACPNASTVETAFSGLCGMDTFVPGGQQLYIAEDGHIGFTQAHSAAIPQGANPCPFTYEKKASSQFGIVNLDPSRAFGAVDFMGCPTDSGKYQVFAALQNATVPQGNVTDCIGFSALAFNYTGATAWQYT